MSTKSSKQCNIYLHSGDVYCVLLIDIFFCLTVLLQYNVPVLGFAFSSFIYYIKSKYKETFKTIYVFFSSMKDFT